MYKVICVSIGYAFGNFLTAEIISHKASGKSVFVRGSGNPGMANIASLYGMKYGIIVLLGDLLKTFIPCMLCRYILFPDHGVLAAAYTGLGVILGHDYPFWHRFKGGKGVSCTCAALISISLPYGLIACIIGLLGLLISKYMPIGAILIPIAFIIPAFSNYGIEIGSLTIIMTLVMLQRHLKVLRNIPAGKEPKKDLLKKLKKTKAS